MSSVRGLDEVKSQEFINAMIKIRSILYISIALLLAGCTNDDDTHPAVSAQDANVITLGVKEVVSPVSRAQHTGSMDFTQLTTTGFGVYGYEGADAYNSSSSSFGLFPPNTPVTFVTDGTAPTTSLDIPGSWKYTEESSELKPWNKDKKYTFFAYAPYMSVGEGTYGTDPGINAISTGSGDPTISYTVATDPAESVDLLWGVRTDTKEKSGLPWKDLQQGQTNSAVLFTFYHALCAIGVHAQVIVDQQNRLTDIDDESHLGTIGDPNGCKVTLKSITITPAGTLHKSGVLNLNNTKPHEPNWKTESTSDGISSLVIEGAVIDPNLLDPHTDDEDDYEVMTSAVPGVTESANTQTVIAGDKLFMHIPQEAQDYNLTVEYFLTYKTESGYHRELLSGTAKVKDLKLVAGVKYYLNLVFGLTTFKLNVTATDWEGEILNKSVVIETGTSASSSLAKQTSITE